MIQRYSRKPMSDIWTETARYDNWWKVEFAALEVRADRGEVSRDVVDEIEKTAKFTLDEIHQVESEVHHDVIAFLTVIAKYVGPNSRYIHLGLTSSDIVDTAFALQIKDSFALLMEDIQAVRVILRRRALEFKHLPAVGRTHGMHAEPTIFGLRFALWDDEFLRHEERMLQLADRLLVGKLSGAVGIYGHTDLAMEEAVMEKLGIGTAAISTQVVSRDRHAEFLSQLALIGSTIEKIATEFRHLQRTEVGEVYEPFGEKQKGSSAMPHKRNPILSERLCGMSRMLRGYALTGLENVALWHERDISHSSTERVVFPDACILLDYMMHTLIKVLEGLNVKSERVEKNIDLTRGLLSSEKVLIALAKSGWTREKSYSHVQMAAKKVWNEEISFVDALLQDEEVTQILSQAQLEDLVKIEPRFEVTDQIYQRLKL